MRRVLFPPFFLFILCACSTPRLSEIHIDKRSYKNSECMLEIYIPKGWKIVEEVPPEFEHIMKIQGYYGAQLRDHIKLLLVNTDTKGLIHMGCEKMTAPSVYDAYLEGLTEHPEFFENKWEERRDWAEKHGAERFEYDMYTLTSYGGKVFVTRIDFGAKNGNFKNEGTLFAYKGGEDSMVVVDIGLSSAAESYDINYVAYLEVIDSMEYSVIQRYYRSKGWLK